MFQTPTHLASITYVSQSFFIPASPTLVQARHYLNHHFHRRLIQRFLLGIWRRPRHNSSPHSSRRILRALLQRLSRSTNRMGRRPRTSPRSKLVRFNVCPHSLVPCHFITLPSSPLNSIGMPYYTTPLLSSWTPHFLSSTIPPYPPPAKIPPQILSTMKINDNVAYAALPKELRGRRNRVVVSTTKDQGRFRSGKARRDDDVSSSNVPFANGADPWYRSSSSSSLSTIISTRYPAYIAKSRSSTPNSGSKTLISGTCFLDPFPRSDLFLQVLQQDNIQRSRNTHPQFVHESDLASDALHSSR